VARHRRPRRGSPPPPPADAAPHPMPAAAPWLRVVPPLPEPTSLAEVLPTQQEVQVIYPGGERLRVPIRDGMVLHLGTSNGQPTIGVHVSERA
jgi:hypothetical protein